MGHNQLGIARQVLQSYTKCIGRQEASAGHQTYLKFYGPQCHKGWATLERGVHAPML